MHLRDVAPVAQHTHRIFTTGQSVDDFFRQQRSASADLLARSRHKTRGTRVLIGLRRLGDQRFIFFAGEDCHLAERSLLKSNVHSSLSVVYFASMSDRDHNDCAFLIKDNAPIGHRVVTRSCASAECQRAATVLAARHQNYT